MLAYLSGKKTHIAAALGLVVLVVVNVLGVPVNGVQPSPDWVMGQALPLALAMTGRSALGELGRRIAGR